MADPAALRTPAPAIGGLTLSDQEFDAFRRFFYKEVGITLAPEKRALVLGRLSKRINDVGQTSFSAYYKLITSPGNEAERQIAINLITTNETYFFREPRQLTLLRDKILPAAPRTQPFRVWCAASSSGEEPYSLAMILDAVRGQAPWSLMASDISTRVLDQARRGLYVMNRHEGIPNDYLKRYCRKGVGEYANHLLIDRALRERVDFRQVNLMQIPGNLGMFDAIFIRNVIIYFDAPTRATVLNAVIRHLVPGGWLFLGHSETIHGAGLPVEPVEPATYRRPAEG